MTNNIILNAQKAVAARADFVSQQLLDKAPGDPLWRGVAEVFRAAYQNPILTTADLLSESPIKVYAGTGGWGCYGPPDSLPGDDYPNALADMWIRDACAQYHAYLGIIADHRGQPEDEEIAALGSVIEGVVRTCADFLTRKDDNPKCHHAKDNNITVHAFDRHGTQSDAGCDYEPDSLAYLIFLAWSYEAASGSSSHLDAYFWKAMEATIQVLDTQDTDKGCLHMFDDGSALTMTPVRPSDDRAERAFNIPVNAFCAVAMEKLADLAQRYSDNPYIISAARNLGSALRRGVETKGVVDDPTHGLIYAYETNAGLEREAFQQIGVLCSVPQNGEPILMDDANVPSLLSSPYLGFCLKDDPRYIRTRCFLLSSANPFYFISTDGTYAGIGSPHTQEYGNLKQPIWPLALIIQGLTSTSASERKNILKMLVSASQPCCSKISYGCDEADRERLCKTYPANNYMHESFEADDPSEYTRGWFAWANALFGEWVDTMVTDGSLPS